MDLEQLLVGKPTSSRLKLRILDACSLLKLGERAGFSGHQGGARPESGEVAADGARFKQLETVVELLGERAQSGRRTEGEGVRAKDVRRRTALGRKAGAQCTRVACALPWRGQQSGTCKGYCAPSQ